MPRKKAIQKGSQTLAQKTAKNQTNTYERIREIIENARNNIVHAVNTEMVLAYWHIGREIVEEEQKGKKRAAYGKQVLEKLSQKLSEEFGKGFDVKNLWNMRLFYQTYPILDALRRELSWTHYRILIGLIKPKQEGFMKRSALLIIGQRANLKDKTGVSHDT
jgi:hypothetical protein